MNEQRIRDDDTGTGPAPFFGSWKRMYAVVLAFLGILILLFTWFSVSFR
jgi:hypothetical protein